MTNSNPARSASPSNSFYAMSDDEEGDYNTIGHTTSSRGVKLLFSKSKVYIHPTPSAKDNIPGYIGLLQQKPAPETSRPTSSSSATSAKQRAASSLLLAWLPESSLGDALNTYVKVDLADNDGPPKQSYLVPPPPTTTTHLGSIGHYAFAIPVSAIYSLLVRPPSLGWWFGSLIINNRMGESFPALFFHDSECQSTILQRKKHVRENLEPFGADGEMFWGGDEVLRWLRRYVDIERSGAEPNIYLVNPSADDKEAFGGKPITSAPLRRPSNSGMTVRGAAGAGPSSRGPRDAAMDPVTKFVKEAGWSLMEKLSKVTTFTRRTADSVIDNPKVPPQVRRLLRNPEVQTLQDEFDSARIYLARWAMGIAEQSERDRNQRIWTARDVLEMEETDVGEFELLDTDMGQLSLQEQRRTVTLKEWNSFFDERTGRLQVTVDEVKERIFHGGLDAEDGVRKEAWLFLLGVYDWESSTEQRKTELASLRDEYVRLKGAWWDRLVDLGGENEEGEWWREQRSRIGKASRVPWPQVAVKLMQPADPTEKDVHRTDRTIPLFAGEDTPHPDPNSPFAEVGTNVHLEQLKDMLLTYNEYNRQLGYVQGMSDLLAPIYAVMQDDAAAFWGFQHFMERMERNFLRDQSGMRKQLLTLDHLVQLMDPKLYLHLQSADSTNFFFFFRMLLVWYKREFEWNDVLRLWEGLWTDYWSSGFHLFVAFAILEKHRDVIMDHLKHFDEVLKYVNELSSTIDLEETLIRAEALFRRFQRMVESIDKKGSFPNPKLRQRVRNSSSVGVQPLRSPLAQGSSSGVDVGSSSPGESSQADTEVTNDVSEGATNGVRKDGKDTKDDKGKKKDEPANVPKVDEMEDLRPRVISPELRGLLSRKVEVLTRKVVRKEGTGIDGLKGGKRA